MSGLETSAAGNFLSPSVHVLGVPPHKDTYFVLNSPLKDTCILYLVLDLRRYFEFHGRRFFSTLVHNGQYVPHRVVTKEM